MKKHNLLIANNWNDYQLIDCGDGERLEKWGNFILVRPDLTITWSKRKNILWKNYDARYKFNSQYKGQWEIREQLPEFWTIGYNNLTFKIRLTSSKQVGLFPEQAVNWDWFSDKIGKANKTVNVLNLFAYTGGATVSLASAGAIVCHVDSSKTAVQWCKENSVLSGLEKKSVRYIVDDCVKFINREIKRGKKYDAIIMDPPSYGHGKEGEIWKFEDDLLNLLTRCRQILSDNPLFFLINSYTTGFHFKTLAKMLEKTMRGYGGIICSGEIGLPIQNDKKILKCGIYARWENKE